MSAVAAASGGGSGRLRGRPGFVPASRRRAAAMCGRRRPATSADDLCALIAPLERELGVLLGPDALVEAPTGIREVPEVRVDTEREVGEVAEPRQHRFDVLGRKAVDQERRDAELLELGRGATEEVAFGATPVLAVDPADAVPAAAEAQPHRQARVERDLDRGHGQPVPDERHRLHQEQVGRVVLEDSAQQPQRA